MAYRRWLSTLALEHAAQQIAFQGYGMSDVTKYRQSDKELLRTEDLLRVIPKRRRSVLDIGARDGHFSRLLTTHFEEVTALDLGRPAFDIEGVHNVAGDVTKLSFADNSFDCVFCAEVLEHVPNLLAACSEIQRVAKYDIVIGVPYKQDTRVGRATCSKCWMINPPWGHLHSFDQERLVKLFPQATPASTSFVAVNKEATNWLSSALMDLGGNPWGAYAQDQRCLHCGATLVRPTDRLFWQRACSALAVRLNKLQGYFERPKSEWIHVVFEKQPFER